ncbi:unnamed protein product [Litomosoides sigmodontis]|uniref:Uncharacterized protein n=1 Tax=Litomosoides sigmodontis TaxID=42156 RepID=A0A3P6U5G2_LITSI|nr:unnamed protein product [Litomosoides sigmodontis]
MKKCIWWRVRCGLCVINEHAKRGHNVSKYGDSGEVIKRAQRTLNEILNETVQFLTVCEKLAADSLVCVDNLFKLLDGQRTYFKALIVALGTDVFLSKKDIEMRLENARQLHGIYMRSALEFTRLMSIMFNEISTLTEKTAAELAGHTVYGDILSKREMIAQSEQEQTQTQSWFEYQRTGRVSTLCSALARRNAAIARRRLMTYNPQSESGMTVNTLPLSSASSSIASAFPVSRNEILLVDRT